MVEQAPGGIFFTVDGRLSGAEDPRLFVPDVLARGPEILHVIQIDGHDHGAIRIEDIDRVESPPEADFENDDIERRVGK
jgi:hypothetical protein